MIDSVISSLLGIKYPLLQGGMAWIADGKLAAAVSEAGGLGIITGVTQPSAAALRDEIERSRLRLLGLVTAGAE